MQKNKTERRHNDHNDLKYHRTLEKSAIQVPLFLKQNVLLALQGFSNAQRLGKFIKILIGFEYYDVRVTLALVLFGRDLFLQ